MKRFYAVFCAIGLFSTLAVSAQNFPIVGHKPMNKTIPAGVNARFDGTAYLDLDAYDGTFNTISHYGGIGDGTNSYQCNNTDTLTGSFAVVYSRFDTLYTTTDYSTFDFTPNNAVISVLVDSIFLWCVHDNTSGMNDTLDIKLVGLDASRRPVDGTVLWSQQEVTNTDLGATGVVLSWAPGLMRTGSNWGFAMRAEYRDPSVLDTFNVVFGQIDDCSPSEVYPAAFYRVNLGPGIAATDNSILIPLANNTGYWFNDCNGNLTAEWPEENSFTHWGMWAVVTIVENMGLDEQDAKDINFVVYPNPASDVANVRFELENNVSNDVTMTVTDLAGKVIESRNLGTKNAGTFTQQIDVTSYSTGIYMVTLDVDGVKITRRMIKK